MTLLQDILGEIDDRPVEKIAAGAHYVAVKIGARIGLAHRQIGFRERVDTTRYEGKKGAHLISSDNLTEAAIGAAAINAQLSVPAHEQKEIFDHILSIADRYKKIGIIGYFPFVTELRKKRGDDVLVFELMPFEGCLPVDQQDDLLPSCDLVVISGSTFANGTLEHLLEISTGHTMVIGPTTPITPVLFDYGADLIAGVVARDEDILAIVNDNGGTKAFKRLTEDLFIEKSEGEHGGKA